FRLEPGAKNDIVIGVVWVRPPIGTYPCPSYKLLKQADLKAQALFDNCFQLKDGPPAPDLSIIELDKELIISLENTKDVESFTVADPQIKALGSPDSLYKFEGYQIYQLENPDVSAQDYDNPDKARLVLQSDIKNDISKIVNYVYDVTLDVGNPNLQPNVPVLMVDGRNSGIVHTIDIKNDAFASGDQRLVNHKTYYYSAISYSFNYYELADTVLDDNGSIINITTQVQMLPYLAGRKNITIYTAIPHIPAPEFGGLDINASYGNGPEITRQEGTGNGKLATDLTDLSVSDILASPTAQIYHQTYQAGKGPVSITVYNPKVVPSADFEFAIVDSLLGAGQVLNAMTTYWYLKNINTGEIIYSDFNLAAPNQQIIPDWGLQIYLEQVRNPGGSVEEQTANNNGFIESTLVFSDPQKPWLTGLQDQDGETIFSWIRAGIFKQPGSLYPDYVGVDDNQVYENVIDRTWSPYRLATDEKTIGPAWADAPSHISLNPLDSLMNIDVVFTSDKTKWSQCIVVEEQNETALSEGGVAKLSARAANSRDVNNNEITTEQGRSYFPGYAINPVTGERLNIFFGEDSWLAGQNGNDMWWNPTADIFDPTFNTLWIGGKHYIYVASTRYDGCAAFLADLHDGSSTAKREVYKSVRWCNIPLLAPGFSFNSIEEGFIPNQVDIRIRVTKPYAVYHTDAEANAGMPRYTFSTASLAAVPQNTPTAIAALDTINVVPNPYYAYSAYEQSQLDNRIKITNLPQKCTITIYSLDGRLVRKISRDDASVTSVDWDLKNDAGVPIASGLYIIHIDAPGLGEKTLKWFGVLRPSDLNNY
ncbi:MAG: hypothetical protein ABIQ74_06720, partial [Chitinophagales bacterium]